MNAPTVVDTTLRDGSHAVAHRFATEQVRDVVAALDGAGVPIVEVSHGDGLGASSLQCGFSRTPELELISEAVGASKRARVAVMLLPGMGTLADVEAAAERGARILRVAALCTEADVAVEQLERAAALGLQTMGFLMLAHLRPPEFLAEQAKVMAAAGVSCVYLADSAGALLPDGVRARVEAVRDAVDAPVGFHAHNNLGLALGNCVAALEAGAELLDGSLRGLGAGAGNAPTELIAAVLDRMGLGAGLDPFALMDAAEFVVAPFMPFQPLPDRDSATLGYAGVYSTFLLHAKHAAERYGVDTREILVELGRRQAVVGQEDWPADIAAELAGARPAAA